MDENKKNILRGVIKANLDRAEAIWDKKGQDLIIAEATGLETIEKAYDSAIPGFSNVTIETNEVATFIALVVDIRKSSEHLLCHIANTCQDVTMLKRVYYETSALLPALARTISFEKGSVTEYLGDGVLAFFQVDDEDSDTAVYSAYRAANNCIDTCRELVNLELFERYNLPALDIGIGMATSKALVTLVGDENDLHPKAFGECVFRATKLSDGHNKIYVDDKLEAIWPTSPTGGSLSFKPKAKGNIPYFVLEKKN